MAIASAWYSVDTDARCVPGGGSEAFGAAHTGPSTLVRPVSGPGGGSERTTRYFLEDVDRQGVAALPSTVALHARTAPPAHPHGGGVIELRGGPAVAVRSDRCAVIEDALAGVEAGRPGAVSCFSSAWTGWSPTPETKGCPSR